MADYSKTMIYQNTPNYNDKCDAIVPLRKFDKSFESQISLSCLTNYSWSKCSQWIAKFLNGIIDALGNNVDR